MCPARLRKGKRFYDDKIASGEKCGTSAADFNRGQAVAGTYETNTGVDIDGIGTDVGTNPQTSSGGGSFGIDHGLEANSVKNKFGVDWSFPTVGNVVGQLPSLINPTAPVAVSPGNEAGARTGISPNMFTTLFSYGTPGDR
ncbi:hypothetical protein MMC29_002914 [Sticta canariensis]|nr:hypothetical protein [Sticta canariensis]